MCLNLAEQSGVALKRSSRRIRYSLISYTCSTHTQFEQYGILLQEGLSILTSAVTGKEGELAVNEQDPAEQPNLQQRSISNSSSRSTAQVVGDSRRRLQQSYSSPNNSPQLSQDLSQYGRLGRRAFSPPFNNRSSYSNNNSVMHIATENDHYWLAMMQQDRRRNPHGLEQSLLSSLTRNNKQEEVAILFTITPYISTFIFVHYHTTCDGLLTV